MFYTLFHSPDPQLAADHCRASCLESARGDIFGSPFVRAFRSSFTVDTESPKFFEKKGALAMAAATIWDGLTRSEQRLLIKLFGCGSTRHEKPEVVDALRARGLLDENSNLSKAGLFILTLALRDQQIKAHSRFAAR
jgi:hypothetical protein